MQLSGCLQKPLAHRDRCQKAPFHSTTFRISLPVILRDIGPNRAQLGRMQYSFMAVSTKNVTLRRHFPNWKVIRYSGRRPSETGPQLGTFARVFRIHMQRHAHKSQPNKQIGRFARGKIHIVGLLQQAAENADLAPCDWDFPHWEPDMSAGARQNSKLPPALVWKLRIF